MTAPLLPHTSTDTYAAHIESFMRHELRQQRARFEVDAVYAAGAWPAFRSTFDEREAHALTQNFLHQGFAWVRLRLADEYNTERFAPLVLLEKGARP